MVARLLIALALGTGHGAAEGATLDPSQAASQDVITAVRVHGNQLTSDADIVKLAGATIGAPVGPTTVADIAARLRASKRFQTVDVLKRFASIADPSQIVIVIIVDEGPVRLDVPDSPSDPIRVVKRRGLRNLMFMPILDAEDGYGVTYGVRFALVGLAGDTSRFSFPLSWGGLKRAGAEFDRTFSRGPFSRVEFGGAIQQQQNPAFVLNDDRRRVWARVDRAAGPIRAGGTVGWQHVTFGGTADSFRSVGGDLTLDTRIDPVFPRNAILAVASWEHLDFASGGATNRTRLEGNGYVGLIGQTVLALRAVREDANRPLPLYLKSLVGGWSNLRGFKAGSFTGDTMVTGSAELRIPLTSPLNVGKLGVSVFEDVGTAYDKGDAFRVQMLREGIGASVWLTAAAFRMSLSVAHGRGASTRVNFGAGLTF